ncbi:alkaline phosphatase family protein [Mycobacterium vicinigordonae]|uniref:alkaline phosphatase family protein n=1 Tax=Mycobacterium vicinigordonae TaxID=1719132 RepID=UPI001BB44835|nr:alkaline phosphatase family protein [Mycobacterium vicinigordonae]
MASLQQEPTGPGFEHLVVLMFENRSFDNLLGHLYPPGSLPDGEHFDGVANGQYCNSSPSGPIAAHVYQGPTDRIFRSPNPDPGEEYPHINTQLFGVVDPPTNAERDAEDMVAPWNTPGAGMTPTMDGFVTDYINAFCVSEGRQPTPEEYSVIMGGFSPDMLPVVSTLARNFAVYDAWFCGVPSQTLCNRSFFNASTSSGFVTNKCGDGYKKWLRNKATTIFDRLEEAGIPWAIYYDESQIVPITGFVNAPSLERYWKTRFFGMDRFYEDVANGKLPAYSFIEPRILFNHNDMHPSCPLIDVTMPDGTKEPIGVVNDVRAGEKLLHEVYSAIRTSATPNGSNNQNTLLLVTFDEHGGCYDHVPPPAAVPPDPVDPVAPHSGDEPEMGFGFDRLGVRIPAIAISAWTKAGTIIHDQMHHGSAIATLCRKYGLAPLTQRDAAANDLTNALNLTEPRQLVDWPETTPQYVPPNPEANGPFTPDQARAPLTPPGLSLMGMLAAKFGLPASEAPTTYGEAYDMLQRCKGMFG